MQPFDKPTLLVDKAKCVANIRFMVDKANGLGVALRPHFKTHQSIEVGRWFRNAGVNRIAVSSIPMARYFASDGWNDILVAIPVTCSQSDAIDVLSQLVNLTLTVSTANGALGLARCLSGNVSVMVEIDCGHDRSGLKPNLYNQINDTIRIISENPNLHFAGFLTHAGNSYRTSFENLEELNRMAIETLVKLRMQWVNSFPGLRISYGDTPTCVVASRFEGVDELRPGNFVFFDMQQASQGVCSIGSIALALACPVIAAYPQENKIVVWGGAVHLSKDFFTLPDGDVSFGAVCSLQQNGRWGNPIEGVHVASLSQEHGVIRGNNSDFFQSIREGDWVAILPAHSCLTVSCMGQFFCADEKETFSCLSWQV